LGRRQHIIRAMSRGWKDGVFSEAHALYVKYYLSERASEQ
jgi:hypothetical protein